VVACYFNVNFRVPPKSFFDSPAHGSTNYGSSPKTEFFNSIDPKQKSDLLPLCANSGHAGQVTRRKNVNRAVPKLVLVVPLPDRQLRLDEQMIFTSQGFSSPND